MRLKGGACSFELIRAAHGQSHSSCVVVIFHFSAERVFSDNNLAPLGQHHVSEASGKLLCEREMQTSFSLLRAGVHNILKFYALYLGNETAIFYLSVLSDIENVFLKTGDALCVYELRGKILCSCLSCIFKQKNALTV